MFARKKGTLIAIAAGLAGFVGWQSNSSALPITTSPAVIDGWTISWPTSIQLQVSQDANPLQVDLQETAKFTALGQGFQFTIAPTFGSTPTADLFVMTNESIADNTSEAFADLSFILINTGTADATMTKVFSPPSGTGYDYTSDSIVNANEEVDYAGTQNTGVTSLWGNGVATSSGNNLTINAPSGSSLAVKDLSVPGTSPIIPEPAGLSLLALAGFAVSGNRRRLFRQAKSIR